ncbi:uL15 family ribosomal protein [Candidatus Micrarchaeota archaeon]|nr:uL15 family ribosomal protein [Candidatus Micrarchaeota archaeon]MBU1939512.1 uL15 family ribosomal protein [Candidatus Micrarchaeota archaeon]
MVVRRDKKKIKLRGQRYHGGGNTKNRRGAGCRGGRGRAGSHKHKFSKYYGDYGMKRKLKAKKKGTALNICGLEKVIERLSAKKEVEKEGALIVIDGRELGIEKILGMGMIKEKVLLRNVMVSRRAKEAVEKAGGKVEGIDEFEEAENSEDEATEGKDSASAPENKPKKEADK